MWSYASSDIIPVFTGQNLYTTTVLNNNEQIDVEQAMKGWFEDEKVYYDYNTETCTPGQQCGHYTQVRNISPIKINNLEGSCNVLFLQNAYHIPVILMKRLLINIKML